VKAKRQRAVATPGNGVGPARYHLYREAYAHANQAIKDRYYLEAIAVTESLLADRLESRASFLLGADFSFKTLEGLIRKMLEIEVDRELKNLVSEKVAEWKDSRNRALHEMAKLARGNADSWLERTAALPQIAKEGLKVVRHVDRRLKELRKSSNESA
jgi:hypothetical protein